jgi:uncharacterized protein
VKRLETAVVYRSGKLGLNYAVSDQLILDSRRAAWLVQEKVLAVADLHLGYTWAQRLAGQLMPITPVQVTLSQLLDLQRDYQPAKIVFLGDVVHRAVAVPALEKELKDLIATLAPRSELVFLAGNHDRHLPELIADWQLPMQVAASFRTGPFLLLHGDETVARGKRARRWVIMGHEHPAISIGDGVTTMQKCPCFLLSDKTVVLPAFSSWAAGTNVRRASFMSTLAKGGQFTRAIAICGDKLLPLSL